MAAASLKPAGAELWPSPVPEPRPGVYLVSLAEDPDATTPTISECPVDSRAIEELLRVRPELTLDRERPSPQQLADRISAFWLPDETILYIGLAGTSVAHRVRQYHRTRLGARSPHAGGWFLKTLRVLPELRVHYAACGEPLAAENQMLAAFAAEVSGSSRQALHDPDRVMPFANLEHPKGRRKRHGIEGAKEARHRQAARPRTAAKAKAARPRAPASTSSSPLTTPHLRSQRVTAADLGRGQIRIPRGPSKALFPADRTDLTVNVRGVELSGRWDPRLGPPERSGVMRVGKQLAELVGEDEVLALDRWQGRVGFR